MPICAGYLGPPYLHFTLLVGGIGKLKVHFPKKSKYTFQTLATRLVGVPTHEI